MKLVVALVVGAILFASYAYATEDKPASCVGPSASATVQGTRLTRRMGEIIHAGATKPIPSPESMKEVIDGIEHTLARWIKSFIFGARGKGIPPEIIKVERADDERRRDAKPCSDVLAPEDGDTCVDPPAGQSPFDPKSAAFSTAGRSTGARVAADALGKAGFPADEIPMGVAVARFESGWRNIPGPTVNGSTMRGMWQINWNVHPEVHGFGDWRDPYVNARMAYTIWKAAGGSWSPWSTASTARRHADEYRRFSAIAGAPTECTPQSQDASAGRVPDGWNQLNPRTVNEAIAAMSAVAGTGHGYPGERVLGRCERYMNLSYGLGSGPRSARAHWASPGTRHVGRDIPPRGALVFWDTGTYGHVALSLGGGRVISTDYNGKTHRYQAGMVGIGPLSDLDRWGDRLGWRPPAFNVGVPA